MCSPLSFASSIRLAKRWPLQAVQRHALVAKIALRRENAYSLMRQCAAIIANSASCTDNASSCACQGKPFPSRFIALSESYPSRPPHMRLPARPPRAHRTTPWYSCFAQAAQYHRVHLHASRLDPQIVLLGLQRTKSSPAPPEHDTREACRPTARTSAHESLLRLPVENLRADVASGPLSSACASAATVTASEYFSFALYCSAPPAFLFYKACRARPLSNAAPGIQAHNSVCCSGRISCPRLSQSRWRRRRTA